MGRQRKRDRAARAAAARLRDQSGALPVPPGAQLRSGSTPDRSATAGDAPYTDAQFRKAERRRVMLLGLLPGPGQSLARQGGRRLVAVVVVQSLLVLALGLLLARSLSGQWLPSYAGVLVLGLAVASQLVCRAVNSRASDGAA